MNRIANTLVVNAVVAVSIGAQLFAYGILLVLRALSLDPAPSAQVRLAV